MAAAVASGHSLDYSTGHQNSDVAHGLGLPHNIEDGGCGGADLSWSNEQDFQQLVLTCNKDGMEFLRKALYKQSFEQLKYAEAILVDKYGEDAPTSLLAVTCNNLGCYYKKVGKLHAALSYLRKALKIEVSLQTDDVTVAGTHLNICAILSKLDKHEKAVQHALCALELISNRANSSPVALTQEEYSVLAIAHHNVAVEQDHLHQWDLAATAYQQGHEVARRCLGEQHLLTQTLGRNAEMALLKARRHQASSATAAHARESSRERSAQKSHVGEAAKPLDHSRRTGTAPQQQLLPEIQSARVRPAQEEPALTSAASFIGRGPQVSSDEQIGTGGAMGGWRSYEGGQQHPQQPQPPPHHPQPPLPLGLGMANVMSLPVYSTQSQLRPGMVTESLNSSGAGSVRNRGNPTFGGVCMGASFAPAQQEDGRAAFNPGLLEFRDQPPTFLDSYARDVQQLHASAASPPPLVVMSRESPSSLPLKVRGDSARTPREPRDANLLKPTPPAEVASQTSRQPRRPMRPPEAPPDRPRLTQRPTTGFVGFSSDQLSPARMTRAERELARQLRANEKEKGLPEVRDRAQTILRKSAAERIQKEVRIFLKAKRDRRLRDEQRQRSAIKIQARFRAFRVRHAKRNKYATIIQRYARGFIVRQVLHRCQVAAELEREAFELKAREAQRKAQEAAVRIQSNARGRMGRNLTRSRTMAVLESRRLLLRAVLRFQATKIVLSLKRQYDIAMLRERASTTLQSFYRGQRGREKARRLLEAQLLDQKQRAAATKIQSHVRRKLAHNRVKGLRVSRLYALHIAATTIQKYWKRHAYRKRYLQLRREYLAHESSIVTIQRFVRGYLVRRRMWRDAIREEEELWAAVEIQRCWRGFLGRVRWELAYEAQWSRDVAARRLQRYVRGWLARTRVQRMRKRVARAEFMKARRRFRAAQQIQAMVRGHQSRKRVEALREKNVQAITHVQRIWRGRRTRCALWESVYRKRVVQIQALARGYIIRRHMRYKFINVTSTSATDRRWLPRPVECY